MKVNLTAGRVDGFKAGADGKQAFLWDSTVPGLGIRATAKSKAFIYQGRIDGKALRITIGDVKTWGIDEARAEARRIGTLIDQGIDPRLEKKQRLAENREAQQEAKRADITLGEVWAGYIEARKHRWGEYHLRDHRKMSNPGGESRKRGKGKTRPGVLTPLLPVKLADIDSHTVGQWLQKEAKDRPTQARLAFALLRAFLHWCDDHRDFQGLASPDACSTRVAKRRGKGRLPAKGTVARLVLCRSEDPQPRYFCLPSSATAHRCPPG